MSETEILELAERAGLPVNSALRHAIIFFALEVRWSALVEYVNVKPKGHKHEE